jgi:hypothetical protein
LKIRTKKFLISFYIVFAVIGPGIITLVIQECKKILVKSVDGILCYILILLFHYIYPYGVSNYGHKKLILLKPNINLKFSIVK